MAIDGGKTKVTQFLLFVLFVGHLVFHEVSISSHRFITDLAVLEIFVTLANLA